MVQYPVPQRSLRVTILMLLPGAPWRLRSVPEAGLLPSAPALDSVPEMVTVSAYTTSLSLPGVMGTLLG